MTTITSEAQVLLDGLLKLSSDDRLFAAMTLLQSVDGDTDAEDGDAFFEESKRRNAEMDIEGNSLTREEFMAEVRRGLACASASTLGSEQK